MLWFVFLDSSFLDGGMFDIVMFLLFFDFISFNG